jgi:hypothetical protein
MVLISAFFKVLSLALILIQNVKMRPKGRILAFSNDATNIYKNIKLLKNFKFSKFYEMFKIIKIVFF